MSFLFMMGGGRLGRGFWGGCEIGRLVRKGERERDGGFGRDEEEGMG